MCCLSWHQRRGTLTAWMVKPGQRVWNGAALRDLLNEPGTAARVSNYFDRSAGPHAGFTGAWFEHLGRELERPDDRVTAHDLLAVQTLGVRVPAAAAIALLDTSLGDELGELLAQVPRDLDLADEAAADATASASAASQAWQLLRHRAKIGRVTTAKLLARQRPRLLPVWDSVVDCAVGWTCWAPASTGPNSATSCARTIALYRASWSTRSIDWPCLAESAHFACSTFQYGLVISRPIGLPASCAPGCRNRHGFPRLARRS